MAEIFTEPRSGEVNVLPLFTEIEKNNCFSHRRTGIFLPGGAVNHLPKKFLQVAQILRNSRKETRVIRCTNNGLHMK